MLPVFPKKRSNQLCNQSRRLLKILSQIVPEWSIAWAFSATFTSVVSRLDARCFTLVMFYHCWLLRSDAVKWRRSLNLLEISRHFLTFCVRHLKIGAFLIVCENLYQKVLLSRLDIVMFFKYILPARIFHDHTLQHVLFYVTASYLASLQLILKLRPKNTI